MFDSGIGSAVASPVETPNTTPSSVSTTTNETVKNISTTSETNNINNSTTINIDNIKQPIQENVNTDDNVRLNIKVTNSVIDTTGDKDVNKSSGSVSSTVTPYVPGSVIATVEMYFDAEEEYESSVSSNS